MGAGASAADVRAQVENLGAAYRVYGPNIEENGVDGDLVSELITDEDPSPAFADLGVTNTLHKRRLLQAMRAAHPGASRRGSLGGSTDSAPAVAVAEVDAVAPASPAAGTIASPAAGNVAAARAVPAAGNVAAARAVPAAAAAARPPPVAVEIDGGGARGPNSDPRRTPTNSTWTVSLSWEGRADLDLAAAVFGERGTFLDLVYYARKESNGRAVVHSGDAKGTEETGGSTESIELRPAALDPRTVAVVFFARVHDAADGLGAVSSCSVTVTGPDTTIQPLHHHRDAKSVVVCRMYRRGRSGRPTAATLNVDMLDVAFDDSDVAACVPRCQTLLRDVVDVSANPECTLVLLDKGGLLPLESSSLKLGLGWDPARAGGAMDLDAGAVLLDKDGIYVDFVYFHQQHTSGVQHSGDNRTGEGDGDDEWIRFNLGDLDAAVVEIVVVISAYAGNFMQCRNAFCRLVDEEQGDVEIARWQLSGMFEPASCGCDDFREISGGNTMKNCYRRAW